MATAPRRRRVHHTLRRASLYGRRWGKLSGQFVREYPLCVFCLCHGKLNEGATRNASSTRDLVVDHIEPHRGNERLFWEWKNLQTLCRFPCHDQVKQQHEVAGKSVEQWFALLRRGIMSKPLVEQQVMSCAELVPAWVLVRLTRPLASILTRSSQTPD